MYNGRPRLEYAVVKGSSEQSLKIECVRREVYRWEYSMEYTKDGGRDVPMSLCKRMIQNCSDLQIYR